MKRKPEEKKEGEYPAQESGWEAKRLADEQMPLSGHHWCIHAPRRER